MIDASTNELGGRDVWLRAGQQLLRRGGVAGVKIKALQTETGLTTGSFYHHFAGMKEYLDELAAYWGLDTPGHIAEVQQEADPRTRLVEFLAIAPREDLQRLDRAMRDWAGSDQRAAAAVKRVDEALMTFCAEVFTDLGYDEIDARICAQAVIATGVARVTPPWPAADDHIDRLLDIFTRHMPNTTSP